MSSNTKNDVELLIVGNWVSNKTDTYIKYPITTCKVVESINLKLDKRQIFDKVFCFLLDVRLDRVELVRPTLLENGVPQLAE